jgi:hypothetical protein
MGKKLRVAMEMMTLHFFIRPSMSSSIVSRLQGGIEGCRFLSESDIAKTSNQSCKSCQKD